MQTLGRLTEGTPLALELAQPGSCWRLSAPLDLYSHWCGPGLATQAAAGRRLQLLPAPPGPAGSAALRPGARLWVRLLEDGYRGWVDPQALLGHAWACRAPALRLPDAAAVVAATPKVLAFAEAARLRPNRYLWGGSLGPDYDCSGFIQAAFAAAGVWIPRDAYQQERFCQPVAVAPGHYSLLRPGDLIFFGRPQRCTHVGLHLGAGRYLHSSGREHGRDGLGVDGLDPQLTDPVSVHYRGELRGAGRVLRAHDGSTLP
jgi:NlpC/P60 family/Bacterial dipeptidyl-peptidase Sh3 domain